MSSSSFYLKTNNYNVVNATIEKADCTLIPDKQLYQCDLTLNYMIDGISISNQIIILSDIKYEEHDIIEIEYLTIIVNNEDNMINLSEERVNDIINKIKSIELDFGRNRIILSFNEFINQCQSGDS